MVPASPLIFKEVPNMFQNQYEQICLLFAPRLVSTAICMLPFHPGCRVFEGGDPTIPGLPSWTRAESADF